MKPNLGNIERAIRGVLGLVFVGLAALGTVGWWGYVVGVILVGTAAVSFCPLWAVLGINTCPVKKT